MSRGRRHRILAGLAGFPRSRGWTPLDTAGRLAGRLDPTEAGIDPESDHGAAGGYQPGAASPLAAPASFCSVPTRPRSVMLCLTRPRPVLRRPKTQIIIGPVQPSAPSSPVQPSSPARSHSLGLACSSAVLLTLLGPADFRSVTDYHPWFGPDRSCSVPGPARPCFLLLGLAWSSGPARSRSVREAEREDLRETVRGRGSRTAGCARASAPPALGDVKLIGPSPPAPSSRGGMHSTGAGGAPDRVP